MGNYKLYRNIGNLGSKMENVEKLRRAGKPVPESLYVAVTEATVNLHDAAIELEVASMGLASASVRETACIGTAKAIRRVQGMDARDALLKDMEAVTIAADKDLTKCARLMARKMEMEEASENQASENQASQATA